MGNIIKVGADRDIKFDKSLRLPRQENYDIQQYEHIEADFKDAGHKKVYKNFNFSIFIDDYCNADCKFCVAQLRYANKNLAFCKGHIDGDNYLKRLDEVLKIVRPLDPSVSITGGEPTLSPILTDVLQMVDSYNFRKRTITSNGSGLFNIQNGSPIIDNLIKYKWDHLNISRAHYNDDMNRKIMRFNTEKEYCTMEQIGDILTHIKDTNLKHRISCLLLKEGINSVAEIKNYVDFYSRLGANNYIFRELMDYDHKACNSEKLEYINANKIKLNDIWNDFEKFPEFDPYLNILGYYYYVEIYKYLGNTIASESANLEQQYAEKAKNPDMVYEMVFHTNGNLCGSWIDQDEVLDRYPIKVR